MCIWKWSTMVWMVHLSQNWSKHCEPLSNEHIERQRQGPLESTVTLENGSQTHSQASWQASQWIHVLQWDLPDAPHDAAAAARSVHTLKQLLGLRYANSTVFVLTPLYFTFLDMFVSLVETMTLIQKFEYVVTFGLQF